MAVYSEGSKAGNKFGSLPISHTVPVTAGFLAFSRRMVVTICKLSAEANAVALGEYQVNSGKVVVKYLANTVVTTPVNASKFDKPKAGYKILEYKQ